MTSEQEELAKAIVMHPSFHWQIGMNAKWLVEFPARYHRVSQKADLAWIEGRALPDLNDHATVGVLIYLLTDNGLKELIHQPLSLENFGTSVARTLLKVWSPG